MWKLCRATKTANNIGVVWKLNWHWYHNKVQIIKRYTLSTIWMYCSWPHKINKTVSFYTSMRIQCIYFILNFLSTKPFQYTQHFISDSRSWFLPHCFRFRAIKTDIIKMCKKYSKLLEEICIGRLWILMTFF